MRRELGCYGNDRYTRDLPYKLIRDPIGGMTKDLCSAHCFDKISKCVHCVPNKTPRETKVATCNHQADCSSYLWPDVWFGDLQTE